MNAICKNQGDNTWEMRQIFLHETSCKRTTAQYCKTLEVLCQSVTKTNPELQLI